MLSRHLLRRTAENQKEPSAEFFISHDTNRAPTKL